MTVTEKTYNLIVQDSNKIELPNNAYRYLCTVGVDYLHVEFEKPTSNEYIKLTCESGESTDNPEGVIYTFFQPARMKNIVEVPTQTRYFTLRPKCEMRTINLVTEKENKVKRMMIRIDMEIHESKTY